jgi:LuxR family maltose regulon positive regulatory protein
MSLDPKLRHQSAPLTYPLLRQPVISRSHIWEQLNQGKTSPLTLFISPAGAGKTTALADWSDKQSEYHVIWFQLTSRENTPLRFWRMIVSHLASYFLDSSAQLDSIIQTGADYETVITYLIESISEHKSPLCIIIDDYHLIDQQAIHTSIINLCERIPSFLRLILSTRSEPPFPLARWRSKGLVYEIRDLACTLEETKTYLERLGIDPDANNLATLIYNKTHGWFGGMQLMTLWLRQQGPSAPVLEMFTGSHPFIAEYVIDEILSKQPEDLRQIFLMTSLVDKLNAELIAAITEDLDGNRILQQLVDNGLFWIPLDKTGTWYRYIPILGDALRSYAMKVYREDTRTVLQRVSRCFATMGLIEDALDAALRADDISYATSLLIPYASELLKQNDPQSLESWLERIPERNIISTPSLLLLEYGASSCGVT